MAEICDECGKPCKVIWVDFGIGPYEFWGMKGTDINEQQVSDCCEESYHWGEEDNEQ